MSVVREHEQPAPVVEFHMPRLSKAIYNLQKLGDHHHHMVRLLHGGMRLKDVAAATGVTTMTVRNARRCDLGHAKASNLHGMADEKITEVSRHIAESAPKAAARLRMLVEGEDTPPAVALGAAKDVLDRAGHQAIRQVSVHHQHMTAQVLKELKEGAREAGIIDVVPNADEEPLLPEVQELIAELAQSTNGNGEEGETDVEGTE